MKLSKFNILQLCLASILHQSTPVFADQALDASIRNAMDAERRGDLVLASHQYLEMAHSYGSRDYKDLSVQLARLLGRRALALQITLYKNNSPVISANAIQSNYLLMKRLEPGNPTWPYLMASWCLKTRSFDSCEPFWDEAINAKYGPESVKEKARRDKAEFASKIRDVQTAEAKDWKEHFDPVKYAEMMKAAAEGYSPPPSRNSSSSGNDTWNGPSNNARAQGDYAAADRLMGGNGTSRDVGLYMH